MKRLFVLCLFASLMAGRTFGQQTSSVSTLGTVVLADHLFGSDLGAKIAAADASLGPNGGEIWVTTSGTLSTQVKLSSNRTLRILGGVTIDQPTTILIPRTSTDVHIICSGSNSVFNNQQTGYNGAVYGFGSIQIGEVGTFNPTTYTYLSSDVAAGVTNLPVTSSAGFVARQDVLLEDGRPGIGRFGEYSLISGVPDGTHITLKYPTEHAYLSAYPTRVGGFSAGTLAKNWSVENCRFTSTTTTPSASGSGGAIDIGIATDGKILNNWVDNVGSRGIIVGASGYPAGRVIVEGNHIRNAGLVPAAGGSPSLEVYNQSSHVTFANNIVWDANSSGIQIHGFHQVISGNQVYGTRNGYACYSLDTAETVILSGNTASECSGNGFQMFGAGTENTTEAQRIIFIGNIAQDVAGDGFSLGTAGSPGYARAIVNGNFAYRARGTNGGFVFYGSSGGFQTHNIANNWSEGNTAGGYVLGTAHLGVRMVGNYSRNNATGYFLNSPILTVFSDNADDRSKTSLSLGSASYSVFMGNVGMTPVNGSFGATSTVLGMRTIPSQFSDVDLLTMGRSTFESLPISSLDGTVVYCTNCKASNPCVSAGSGAIAKRLGRKWVCE